MAVERKPMDALDDVVAMLKTVGPVWVSWYDDAGLKRHVRQMIRDGVTDARKHGRWSSGCLRIECDPDSGSIEVLVTAAYQHKPTRQTADA